LLYQLRKPSSTANGCKETRQQKLFTHWGGQSKLFQDLTLLTCIQELPGLNLNQYTDYLFHGFPQSIQESYTVVPHTQGLTEFVGKHSIK
jgi:hypothetical protein